MDIKTDILYIHPTKSMSDTMYSIMPVGSIALINLLHQNGYSIYGINLGIEKAINDRYSLIEELKAIDYKILLVDLHWYEHSYGATEVAKNSKLVYPNKPVIIGGFTTTIFSDEIIRNFPLIDYAVKGDSEKPLKMLMDYLLKGIGCLEDIPNICYKRNNYIINNDITYACPCDYFDNLDFISIDFVKNQELVYYTTPLGVSRVTKSFWLCVARGCKFNCTYCCGSSKNSHILFGRTNMLIRSIESIAHDMKSLSEKGVQVICPTHDFEMFGKDFYEELFSLVRFNDVNAGLYMECFQLPSIQYIMDIKNTFNPQFTSIEISPLTGDEKVRKINGKNFSNEEFFELLNSMSKNKIKVEIYYSLNLANESNESFDKTLKQIEQIVNFYPLHLLKIICRRVVLDPLAPMREEKYNIKSALNTFQDYYNYCKSGNEVFTGYSDNANDYLNRKIEKYEQFKLRLVESNFSIHIV